MKNQLIRAKSYPIVLKNKNGTIEIIYRNRVEIFQVKTIQTKTEMDKEAGWGEDGWTPEKEVEMSMGSGFKRVNDSDNDDHWKVWNAGKVEKSI
jgi:hypothetical protein